MLATLACTLLAFGCDRGPTELTSEPLSLEIAPSAIALAVGQEFQLEAIVRDSTGEIMTEESVSWSSSDVTVATVSSTGLVVGISEGTASVFADLDFRGRGNAYGRLRRTATVSIGSPEPASIDITPSSIQVTYGESTTFSVEVRDATGAVMLDPVTWSATGGSIDAGGTYTAGSTPGAFQVVGQSSNGLTDTSPVEILDPGSLDEDSDGVTDDVDECPGTPAGWPVDAEGCPLDSDGDGVADGEDACPAEPGPASNAGCPEGEPPPPSGDCEALAGASCWYIEAGASGDYSEANPHGDLQSAMEQAGPGDFLYVAGTFTLADGNPDEARPEGPGYWLTYGRHGDGTSDAWITLKPWPGRAFLVQGDVRHPGAAEAGVNLNVGVCGQYWRVEDLTIHGGYLVVCYRFMQGGHDMEFLRTEVAYAVQPGGQGGNSGFLRVHASNDQPGAPYNVRFVDFYVHDRYGCEGDLLGNYVDPCSGPPTPWDDPNTQSLEHSACLMVQDAAGDVTFEGGRAERCPTMIYDKYGISGRLSFLNNHFEDATVAGICRSSDVVFSGNTWVNVGDPLPREPCAIDR